MTHPMRLILGPPVTGDDFFPRDDVIAALHRGLAAEQVLSSRRAVTVKPAC